MKYNIKNFPRLERLRKAMLEADRSVCVERARYYTEYYTEVLPEEEKTEGRKIPPVLRQARAFRHIMTNRSVKIFPDELIVGSTTSKLLGGLIFPEFLHLAVWPELNTISKRKDNPFIIEQREIDELNDVIFPRWMETNVLQRAKEIWEETKVSHQPSVISQGRTDIPVCQNEVDPFNILEKFSFYLLSKANGISHIAPNYSKGIEKGFESIMDEARGKAEKIHSKRSKSNGNWEFYLAIKTVADGIIAFANRYSDEAVRLSEEEKDSKRKFELIKIADICKRVPAKPARTFHEALQSLWFIQIALHQENYDMGISFGRGDQYLSTYYKRDIERGILKEKDALELLGCLWIKSTDHVAFTPSTGSLFFGGTPSNQPMTIGGVDKEGKDATNELTYLMLEASAMLGVREPNLSARIHKDSSQEYLLKVAETIKESHGTPAVYNDDYIIPIVQNTIRNGDMPDEDARDYAVIGCVEANVQGKTFGMTGAALVNMVSALELTLNDGYYPRRREQVGPHTGDPRKFKSMDELREAFRIQIEFLIMNVVKGNDTLGKAHQELTPTPFLSSLIEGTMEKGMDVTMGSALYNSSGITGMGLSDVADSLTAIQCLVFEGIDLPLYDSKRGGYKVTMEEMLNAVEDDFKNNPILHATILNKAPKYGNNDQKADSNARFVSDVFCKAVSQYDNYRGGKYNPGFWTMTTHVGWGKLGGALPNGRRANQHYASGVTPEGGMDREGPTSSLLSAAYLNNKNITNIYAFNQRFGVISGNGHYSSSPLAGEGRSLPPKYLSGGEGDIKKLSQLIRAYFNEGGLQVQFTVADAAMLREAQRDPEKHRGLIVRISGYTAYFVDLNHDCQDEIIHRTEHRIK